LIAISTRSSLEVRTISKWNKLSQDVQSKPPVVSFRSTLLLKTAGTVENGTPAVTDVRPSPDIYWRTEEQRRIVWFFS